MGYNPFTGCKPISTPRLAGGELAHCRTFWGGLLAADRGLRDRSSRRRRRRHRSLAVSTATQSASSSRKRFHRRRATRGLPSTQLPLLRPLIAMTKTDRAPLSHLLMVPPSVRASPFPFRSRSFSRTRTRTRTRTRFPSCPRAPSRRLAPVSVTSPATHATPCGFQHATRCAAGIPSRRGRGFFCRRCAEHRGQADEGAAFGGIDGRGHVPFEHQRTFFSGSGSGTRHQGMRVRVQGFS